MKSHRMVKVATSPNICIFCISRLQGQPLYKLPKVSVQHRPVSSTSQSRQYYQQHESQPSDGVRYPSIFPQQRSQNAPPLRPQQEQQASRSRASLTAERGFEDLELTGSEPSQRELPNRKGNHHGRNNFSDFETRSSPNNDTSYPPRREKPFLRYGSSWRDNGRNNGYSNRSPPTGQQRVRRGGFDSDYSAQNWNHLSRRAPPDRQSQHVPQGQEFAPRDGMNHQSREQDTIDSDPYVMGMNKRQRQFGQERGGEFRPNKTVPRYTSFRNETQRSERHRGLNDQYSITHKGQQLPRGREGQSEFARRKAAASVSQNDQLDATAPAWTPLEEEESPSRKSANWGGEGPKRMSDKFSRTVSANPRRRSSAEKSNRRADKFEMNNEDEFEERQAKERAEEEKQRKRKKKEARKAEERTKQIEIPRFISVANLATTLRVRTEEFLEKLRELGFENLSSDLVLDYENASLVAMEYNYEALVDRSETEDLKARPPAEDYSLLPPRPPVITIMGHVDHGKTTLLDYMRQSSVAASEHGGITQHIGAFSVPMASGKTLTFLDTPGHAAFLTMRQRGANVTDIVILVVAADESVKPQTIEAIKHAKAAKVPIIVAISKIDREESDVSKVKEDLLRHDVEVEDFNGDVQAIPVSGKTGEGLDKLEEALVTQAEILDMRAEEDGPAEGWVLEGTTKKAGRTATVLVKRGTLRQGDVITAGTTWARVRTLKNEAGNLVRAAGPGTPVEIDGWRDQPTAGDEVIEAPSEQKATSVVEYRLSRVEQTRAAKDMEAINSIRRLDSERREREKAEKEAASSAAGGYNKYNLPEPDMNRAGLVERYYDLDALNDISSSVDAETGEKAQKKQDLYFLIKADVSGSVEAVEGSLSTIPLSNQPINLRILHTGVGPVNESDIDHISSVPNGQGFVVSFNQPVSPHISAEAEKLGVKILDENIIYKVLDSVRSEIENTLPPLITKRVTGEADTLQVFDINIGGRKTMKVAGCRVRNGMITRNSKCRVYRGVNPSEGGTGGSLNEENLIHEGVVTTLKHVKKDVTEMRKGSECGISFENWQGFEKGDLVQCFEEKREKRRLT